MSAYGNVGLSMGFPGSEASLCGSMSIVGKLVIMFTMIIGKLRGLPTHSDAITDFSFKELNYWAKKAKREALLLKRNAAVAAAVHGGTGAGKLKKLKVVFVCVDFIYW